MSERTDQRAAIATSLRDFDNDSLSDAAVRLFGTMGYASQRRLSVSSVAHFLTTLDPNDKLTGSERESLQSLGPYYLVFVHYDGLLKRALASIESTFQKRAAAGLLTSRSAVLPTLGETPKSDGNEFDLVTWLVIQHDGGA